MAACYKSERSISRWLWIGNSVFYCWAMSPRTQETLLSASPRNRIVNCTTSNAMTSARMRLATQAPMAG